MQSDQVPAGWEDISNLVDVGGEAALAVEANSQFDLHFGIDMSSGSLPRPFLYDSHPANAGRPIQWPES